MDLNKKEILFSEFPPIDTPAWEEKIKADLKGADYEKKLIWKSEEGFPVKPYYRSEDLQNLEHLNIVPGEPPYTRGLRTGNNNWVIRQDITTTDIVEANRLALEAIAKGAGAVGLMVREVTTHKQLNRLLQGIDLTTTGIHFLSSRSYPLTLELFIYEINHRESGGEKITGSINFDPISYLLLKGDYYVNWIHNLEETIYLLSTVRKRVPHFKAITVNGHYFPDSGSTLVQELAFSLASACEYLAGLTDKGIPVDEVAPHIQLSLGIGPNYFMEIAKYRAIRLLWTRMIEQFHPVREESFRVSVHGTTSLWNKTIFDPYVNMLRTTTEGMAAALGNADSVTIRPFDATSAAEGEFSRRIARNQQLILKEEAYLDKIADPAGGSYYIENLTHSIAHHAWTLFRKVESEGGILQWITAGKLQEAIAMSRNHKEMDYAQRKSVLVGTTQYPNVQESGVVSKESFPPSYEEKPSPYRKLEPFRAGSAIEALRMATERHVSNGNKRPSVFLLTIGNLAMLRARAGFTTNFFGCAGYDIIDNPGFTTPEEGATAALASHAEVVVICSSDEEYAAVVPPAARLLKETDRIVHLLVAGYPKDILQELQAAGVDGFIHVRSNLLETLTECHSKLGII